VALSDTPFSESLAAASNAFHQASTLGVTATFRSPENNPTTVWHVEPRETGSGTGFVVLITSINGVREQK
jgi:hypothetical protein